MKSRWYDDCFDWAAKRSEVRAVKNRSPSLLLAILLAAVSVAIAACGPEESATNSYTTTSTTSTTSPAVVVTPPVSVTAPGTVTQSTTTYESPADSGTVTSETVGSAPAVTTTYRQ